MSERPLNPHFAIPFRLTTTGGNRVPAVVEQDSLEDVTGCVEAALRTERGSRIDMPDFGVPDPTFSVVPMDLNSMAAYIENHEPRAITLLSEDQDRLDALVDRITASVSLKEERRA